jgi:hypothetical protein
VHPPLGLAPEHILEIAGAYHRVTDVSNDIVTVEPRSTRQCARPAPYL